MYFQEKGIIVGYTAGNIVYNLVILYIPGDPNNIYVITIAVCSLFGYILTKYIDKLIIIIATSLLGGYLFVRVNKEINIKGLSIQTGGYIEETHVYKLVQHQEIRQLDRVSIYPYT